MPRLNRLFAVLVAAVFAVPGSPAFGQGMLVVDEVRIAPEPMPRPRPLPAPTMGTLELKQHQVIVHIDDQVAKTTIEHVFHNPTDRRLEGTFVFPLPVGGQIDKFEMDVNGEMTEAELLDADQAREIYTSIVRSMQDPALLEYADRGLLKARIFPIEPNSDKTVRLEYTQLLSADSGMVEYAYPITNRRNHGERPAKMSLKMLIKTPRPLATVYSPTHAVETTREAVDRDGEKAGRAVIGYESDALPESDFKLYFGVERGDDPVNMRVLTYRNPSPGSTPDAANPEGHNDGFFLLLMSPNQGSASAAPMPKDVVFAIDSSGSMAGPKMTQAKAALRFCVANLNDKDTFQIVRFSTEASSLFNAPKIASEANRKQAYDYIEGLKPIGGTAIEDALKLSLQPLTAVGDRRDASRPYYVIFLTDGKPTIGETDTDRLVAKTVGDEALAKRVRVFAFGIGTNINTRLLDTITEKTRATSEYVLPDEDIEVKVSRFYTKISEPVLANLKLEATNGVELMHRYPADLPDLFKGEQLMVVGRYRGAGDAAVRLTATSAAPDAAGEQTFATDVAFVEKDREHGFIPRMWASSRVGYLLDQVRLHGESEELKDEVTQLARAYGIVTPYTSYLIVEDERRRNIPAARQTLRGVARDDIRLEEAAAQFDRMADAEDGAEGVGAAAGNAVLKRVDAPVESKLAYAKYYNDLGGKRGADGRVIDVTQNTRFLNGKAFVQNGAQWVDTEVQARPADDKPVQVVFNSDAYFQLIADHPAAAPWLAVGRNVQVVIDGQLYEVVEEEA